MVSAVEFGFVFSVLYEMSDSIFVSALAVAIIYLLFRFLEMRFVLRQNRPIKDLLKDSLLVYLSVLCSQFVLAQVGPLKGLRGQPTVFTNDPDF